MTGVYHSAKLDGDINVLDYETLLLTPIYNIWTMHGITFLPFLKKVFHLSIFCDVIGFGKRLW